MAGYRVAYHIYSNVAHISHALPYMSRLGGLVYTGSPAIADYLQTTWPDFPVTDSLADVQAYRPDAVLYPHYTRLSKLSESVKHVQVFHGVSDEPYYYETDDATGYDLCLCSGPMQVAKFREAGIDGHFASVGYPKFELPLEVFELPFADSRPVLLYAPTPGRFSTIAGAADRIIELSEHFNVVVDAHSLVAGRPGVSDQEPAIRRLLASEGPHLSLAHEANLLPLIQVCDLLIGDGGAVLYEALPFDKPQLVVSDQPASPLHDLLGPRYFLNHAVAVAPDELDRAVVDRMLEHDPYRAQRASVLVPWVFGATYGRPASERAVAAIERLLVAGRADRC